MPNFELLYSFFFCQKKHLIICIFNVTWKVNTYLHIYNTGESNIVYFCVVIYSYIKEH